MRRRFTASRRPARIGLLVSAAWLPLCGCQDGSGSNVAAVPPSGLTYILPTSRLALGVVAPSGQSQLEAGTQLSYSIDPALPAGLEFDDETGTFAGIPSELTPPTTHRLLAANEAGSTAVEFELEVTAPFERATYAHVLHVGSDRVATFRVDGARNLLEPIGSTQTVLDPLRAETDPLGRFLFVTSAGSQGVGVHAIDTATGRLGPVEFEPTLGGSFEMDVSSSGRYLAVANLGSNSVETFRIDPNSGQLTPAGPARPLPGAIDVLMTPDERGLIVASVTGNSIVSLALDPVTGAIGGVLDMLTLDTPIDIVLSKDGATLFAAGLESGLVARINVEPATKRFTLEASVSVAAEPVALALAPDESQLFVGSVLGGRLTTIDVSKGALTEIEATPLGSRPAALAVTESDGRLLAALPDAATLAEVPLNGALGQVVQPRSVLENPFDIVISRGAYSRTAEHTALFVAEKSANAVTPYARVDVDGDYLASGASQPLGSSPSAVVHDEHHARLYGAGELSGELAQFPVIDAEGELLSPDGTLALGTLPRDLTLAFDRRFLFATSNEGLRAFKLEDGELIFEAPQSNGTAFAGDSPAGIALHPTDRFAYVATRGSNEIYGFDVNLRTGKVDAFDTPPIATGAFSEPRDLAVSPDGRHLGVILGFGAALQIYSIDAVSGALELVHEIPTDREPRAIAFDRLGRHVLVASAKDDRTTVFRLESDASLTPLSTVPSGNAPNGLCISPDGREVAVAAFSGDRVHLFDFDDESGALTPRDVFTTGRGTGPVDLDYATRWIELGDERSSP